MALTGIAALLFQHFVLYRLLMVPLLSSLQAIPLYWWLCYLVPVTLVLFVGGIRARTFREVGVAVSVLSIAACGLAYLWATTSQPGFYTRYGEGVPYSLLKDFLFHLLLFGSVMGTGRALGGLYEMSLGRLLGGKRKRR